MKTYFKVLDTLENTILAACMFIMLALAFVNVIIRKFTTISFAYTEELVNPLFILLTLVGAAALARRGGHIGLSVLTDLLPQKTQKYVMLITSVVSSVFSIILLYYGFKMVQDEYVRKMMTAALRWPEWVFGSFVPIGAFFMTLEFINFGLLAFIKFKDDTKHPEEDTELKGAEA